MVMVRLMGRAAVASDLEASAAGLGEAIEEGLVEADDECSGSGIRMSTKEASS
jgi:hypothetical protein